MKLPKSVLTTVIGLTVSFTSSFAEPSQAIHVPAGGFSIGNFQVGNTTLSDVQSQLGPANAYDHDEGLVRTLCYYFRINRGVVVLELNASVLGGLQRLTGFVTRFAREHPERCSLSLIDLRIVSIGMGVRLGALEREFRASLPIPFKRNKTNLFYEVEYRREMTDMEFASMKQQWPDIQKPSFFDVIESVRAKFRNGVVEYYEVNRTESY
jgi:hypothetical protein